MLFLAPNCARGPSSKTARTEIEKPPQGYRNSSLGVRWRTANTLKPRLDFGALRWAWWDKAMSKTDDHSKRWLWVGAGVLLLAALVAAWFTLPIKELLDAFQQWIKELGAWGVAAFAGVYIVAVVLLVPASALTLVAGLVFGAWGFPLVVTSATIGASLAFLVARHLARDKVKQFAEQRPKLKAVNQAVAEDGWKNVGLLRLSPLVPFNVQNYLFGVTEVGFYPYLATTLVGIMPGSLLYVLLGALGHGDGGKGAA